MTAQADGPAQWGSTARAGNPLAADPSAGSAARTAADFRLPDRVAREDLPITLVMSGVWLGFMAFPVTAVLTSGSPLWLRILGCAGLALFCAVNLYAYVRPRIIPRLPFWLSTAAYSAVLAASALLAAPTGGVGVIITAVYICALWLFTHEWRVGLPLATLVLVCASVLALLTAQGRSELFWALGPLFGSVIVITLIRFAMGRDEYNRALGAELALMRQQEAFAREVHDVLGHSLTVISVKAQLARRLVHTDPERAEAELASLLELTRSAIGETRSVVSGGVPLTFDDQIAAARAALTAAGISAGLPSAESADSLSPREDALFAACLREATTNAVRHSGARSVRVAVGPGCLTVTDDGVGGAAEAQPGRGLAGVRARAEAASATVTVTDDRPGAERPGTRMEVCT